MNGSFFCEGESLFCYVISWASDAFAFEFAILLWCFKRKENCLFCLHLYIFHFLRLKQKMQGSRVRPNFSRVRLKKNFSRTGASSHSQKKKKVSATQKVSLLFDNRHVRLIAGSKPIRDSEGQTPLLIGRGPDIPVCVCVRLKMRVLLLSNRE